MSSRVAIATVLALVTALFYAISNVLELLEAEQVPDEYAMRPALLLRLIKRPRWLLGLLSDFGGYICPRRRARARGGRVRRTDPRRRHPDVAVHRLPRSCTGR